MKLAIGLFGRVRAAVFVATRQQEATGANASVSWPVGAQAGDFVVVSADYLAASNGSPSGSGWTNVNATTGAWSYFSAFHWKQLSAADITAGGFTYANSQAQSDFTVTVYRGPTGAINRGLSQLNSPGTTSLNVGSVTKDPASAAILVLTAERDYATSSNTQAPPAGWATRLVTTGTSFMCSGVFDLPSGSYVNGTSITISGFSGDERFHGIVLELTA